MLLYLNRTKLKPLLQVIKWHKKSEKILSFTIYTLAVTVKKIRKTIENVIKKTNKMTNREGVFSDLDLLFRFSDLYF